MMAGALLRLWLLAQTGMALLYALQCRALWGLPGGARVPDVPRVVPVLEGLWLFLFLPALWVVAQLWWHRRDAWLAGLALAFGAAWLASHMAGAAAASLADVRWRYGLDALAALAAVPVAARALALLKRGGS